jgi:hypothetical protein
MLVSSFYISTPTTEDSEELSSDIECEFYGPDDIETGDSLASDTDNGSHRKKTSPNPIHFFLATYLTFSQRRLLTEADKIRIKQHYF